MQQGKAFASLLAVSLAEAGRLNDKAGAAEMRCLDLSMQIAAGNLPDAWLVGEQVLVSGIWQDHIRVVSCLILLSALAGILQYPHVSLSIVTGKCGDNQRCIECDCWSAVDGAAQEGKLAQQQPGRGVPDGGGHEGGPGPVH